MSAVRMPTRLLLRATTGLRLPGQTVMWMPRSRVANNRVQPMPAGSRAFWSYIRGFAKSMLHHTPKADQVPILNSAQDPRYSAKEKPLQIEVTPEPAETEQAQSAWITCGEEVLRLRLFGCITVEKAYPSGRWSVGWLPDKYSADYESDLAWMPKEGVIGQTVSLERALACGEAWAEKYFPHQHQYISAHADWMSHPGTEKALDYLFLLNGLDKDGKLRPKELLVDGKTLPVKDLTKGQIYALIQVGKAERSAELSEAEEQRDFNEGRG